MHKILHLFLIGTFGLICFSFIAITNAQGYDSTCDEFYVGQRLNAKVVITGISPEKGLLTVKTQQPEIEHSGTANAYFLALYDFYVEMTCKRALQNYNSAKNIQE